MAAPKSKPDINLKTSSLSILKTNSLKVGLNALTNRLANINGKIELAWLNLSYELFKIKCKKNFLSTSYFITTIIEID